MLLRKTIKKTKKFLKKTLEKFKSLMFGGYKKLTRASSLNLFNNPKMQQLDNFYKEFCQHWDSESNTANPNPSIKASEQGDMESNGSVMMEVMKDEKSVVISEVEDKKDVGCSNRGNVLEEKMKELEMMDMKDEEHVMDVEEVLHYYSLLTSPIYQDLVDKFFTDMYSEFYLPEAVTTGDSMNSSMRKLGPFNV